MKIITGQSRRPVDSELIGTTWRRKSGRLIRVTEFLPARNPLEVHRVTWVVADGSRGPGYGEMDLDTLTEKCLREEGR